MSRETQSLKAQAKKAASGILGLLLLCALPGCAMLQPSEPKPSQSKPTTSTSEPAEPNQTPRPEQSSEPPQTSEPVFIPPNEVTVAVEDFDWYYVNESSGGIPPDANVIGDDVNRLYGTWKGMILAQYEYESEPSTYSCDIASTSGADALLSLYARGMFGSEGWMYSPGDLMAQEACAFVNNTLQLQLQGIPVNLVFWEEGQKQYGVCHFGDSSASYILMLMR